MTTPTIRGDLSFGHILAPTCVDPSQVVVLRHTYTGDGLQTPSDWTPDDVLDYTRRQSLGSKMGKVPPPLWVVFLADGGLRSRLMATYENHGEILAERTDTWRFFDLRSSELLESLAGRLVIEWSRDPVNWAKSATAAAPFPVLEIADPQKVAFPGFDRVILTHAELRAVVLDSRYDAWRTALSAVQGVYVISDTSTGRHYVGKADGAERILGRWTTYARNGHGGNVMLQELLRRDPDHARHFQFSILRVFGPSVPRADVDEAEAHFKRSLLTVAYGLNGG